MLMDLMCYFNARLGFFCRSQDLDPKVMGAWLGLAKKHLVIIYHSDMLTLLRDVEAPFGLLRRVERPDGKLR